MSVLIESFLGLMARNATMGGGGVSEQIVDAMTSIPPEAVPDTLSDVWAVMLDIASAGQRPTIAAMKRALPSRPPGFWAGLTPSIPDLNQLRQQISEDAMRARMIRVQAEIARMAANASIHPDRIREYMLTEAERPMVGAVTVDHARDLDFVARLDALHAGQLPMIRTGFTGVDNALGGGLYTGGEDSVTALLGFTGTGKSRLAKQVGLRALKDGHRVLYYSGEASALVAVRDMAAIHSNVSKKMLRDYAPTTRARLVAAQTYIQSLPLMAYAKSLNVDTMRSLMASEAMRLKQDIADGTALPSACLLVIVDNLDHLIQIGGPEKAHEQLDMAADKLMQTSRRLEVVHTMLLCQATSDSFLKGRAPGPTEFARAKIVGSHCSNIWSIYRPTNPDMMNEAHLKQAKFLIPKSRSGDGDSMLVYADLEMGTWA